MKALFTLIVFLVLTAALLIAGCTQNTAPAQPTQQLTPLTTQTPDTIRVAASPLGNILVDAQGKTLYYFALDIPASGASMCTGSCAGIWPIFYSSAITVSPPLMASDFSSFARADGMSQTTFMGRPLYYFANDTKPGDTNGEGFNNLWYVANITGTVPVAPTPVPTTVIPTTVVPTQSMMSYGGGY